MHLSPDHPLAGILAPLFALRSENDLGIGDTDALRTFAAWAAENGFRLVQLLPVNETGADNSPYNAISSVAIDPCTLALSPEAVPDLTAEAYAAALAGVSLPALRAGPVQYRLVKPLKRRLLEAAFEGFMEREWKRNSARCRKFRKWVKEQAAWLEGYALFRVMMDANGGSEQWDTWPEPQRTLAGARAWVDEQRVAQRRALERKMRYFQYVQWIAFGQWTAVKAACEALGVALMGDLPIGVSYYSADVFCNPEIFHLHWSGGAPPEKAYKDDPFIEKWGQNWGVPLYRWETLRAGGFAWWRQRVHRVREIFHLFRIDHVLGFYRMYGFPWRPGRNAEFLPLSEEEARARTGGELPHFMPRDDASWENREANRREGEETLRALLEEVGEHRLIGEDLGVVPDYVRPSLASLGIAGFKIPQWERQPNWQLVRGSDYPRLSVAAYATHDHPPLAAMWAQMCAAAQAGDGHQRWELEQLCGFAGFGFEGPKPMDDAIHEALLAGLFQSNAWLAIVMITDVFGETTRFNVPGAVADSNWSERVAGTPAQWRVETARSAKLRRLAALIRASGRG
ncbi:MAG: 4-alpha-glucanotransferase [Verrucomicrobiota bacterium]